MPTIDARVAAVRCRLRDAAERAGRSPGDVELIAVTKTVSVGDIVEAARAGVRRFGENRIQDAEPKIVGLGPGHEWHFIGHLQRNKVRRAVALFDWIHSVDSVDLIRRIDRVAGEYGRRPRILLQVNTSGSRTQFGVAADEVAELARIAGECTHVELRGLMTIGPMSGDEDAARTAFRLLRAAAESIHDAASPGVEMSELSMGMTGDFEIAVEEGATMVRIGTAIFGARDATSPTDHLKTR